MYKNIYLFLAGFLIISLTIISLKESSGLPVDIMPYLDKVLHTLAYILLTVLWSLYATKQFLKTKTNRILTVLALFLTIYGIIIELLQSRLTVSRVSEFGDLAANVLGIVFGIIIFKNINKGKLKSNKGLFF